MRSLLRLSAVALMGLGVIAATPDEARAHPAASDAAQAKLSQVGWYGQPTYYGYLPPPPVYYARPRFYAPPVYAPPQVYFAPRPRFYGPPPWAYRHHHGRRW